MAEDQLQSSNLQVKTDKSLALIGGNVSMDSSNIEAIGGQIELGGLAAPGTMLLNADNTGNINNLSFPVGVLRGDVLLTNGAQVNVAASGGGSIAVNARNIDILGRSSLNAGIAQNVGGIGAVAGDINVDATGTVNLENSSVIQNIVNTEATGNAGKINLVTDSLNLLTGSQLFSSTLAKGNGGDVNVRAANAVSFDSAGDNTSTSGIISSIGERGEGRAGDISITSGSFSITNGAQLNSITFGQGNAGNITINVFDTASFDGANAGASGILSAVTPSGVGNAGDINITATNLSVTNGAQLNALTRGRGDAGNVNINARETVSIDGENPNSIVDPDAGVSSIFTAVGVDDNGKQAIGNGGTINIITGSLLMTNGGQLNAITRGRGDAGNVNINARETVSIDGERRLSTTRAASAIFTSVDGNEYSGFPDLQPAIGNGGDIKISANSLSATNGSGVFATTAGRGDAGNVDIFARETISFDGTNSNGGSSGVFSDVKLGAVGNGRNIQITADELFVTNNAILSTTNAGDGAAGNIKVDANSINLNKGTLSSDTVGAEGNINLRTQDSLLLRRGSNITTNATGENVIGGNINIDSGVVTVLENSRISANSADYRGGRVNINTQGIYGTQAWYPEIFRGYITAIGATPDLSGDIQVNTQLDPTRALTEFPINLVDASNQISNACAPGGSQFSNEFVVTGRGGLPMSPTEPLQESSTLQTWVKLKPQAENSANTTIEPSLTTVSNKLSSDSKKSNCRSYWMGS